MVESSSEDVSPIISIPAVDCQDTWLNTPIAREWDSSHSPAIKVRQLVLLPSSEPPQEVKED